MLLFQRDGNVLNIPDYQTTLLFKRKTLVKILSNPTKGHHEYNMQCCVFTLKMCT